jgi:hypothetical protein
MRKELIKNWISVLRVRTRQVFDFFLKKIASVIFFLGGKVLSLVPVHKRPSAVFFFSSLFLVCILVLASVYWLANSPTSGTLRMLWVFFSEILPYKLDLLLRGGVLRDDQLAVLITASHIIPDAAVLEYVPSKNWPLFTKNYCILRNWDLYTMNFGCYRIPGYELPDFFFRDNAPAVNQREFLKIVTLPETAPNALAERRGSYIFRKCFLKNSQWSPPPVGSEDRKILASFLECLAAYTRPVAVLPIFDSVSGEVRFFFKVADIRNVFTFLDSPNLRKFKVFVPELDFKDYPVQRRLHSSIRLTSFLNQNNIRVVDLDFFLQQCTGAPVRLSATTAAELYPIYDNVFWYNIVLNWFLWSVVFVACFAYMLSPNNAFSFFSLRLLAPANFLVFMAYAPTLIVSVLLIDVWR